MGVLKMKIARDDIAEVITSSHARRYPRESGAGEGISVSLDSENANVPARNQRDRPDGRRSHARSRKIRRPRLPRRPAARPHSPRQRHGNPAQSPASIAAETPPRVVRNRSPPKRRWRRRNASGVGCVDHVAPDAFVRGGRRPCSCPTKKHKLALLSQGGRMRPPLHTCARAVVPATSFFRVIKAPRRAGFLGKLRRAKEYSPRRKPWVCGGPCIQPRRSEI